MATFVQFRAEQLANYLRSSIREGKLCNPLPPTRSWSKELGVGRDSLAQALRLLQREGLLRVGPGGARLDPIAPRAGRGGTIRERKVRLVHLSGCHPHLHNDIEWIAKLFELFGRHEIGFAVEKCSAARLRSLARPAGGLNELPLLYFLPDLYHRMFRQAGRSALAIGLPPSSDSLPFITVDQEGAFRHATLSLLRRGFSTIYCLCVKSGAPGNSRVMSVFEKTCREWSHQPIRSRSLYLPADSRSLLSQARRFAMGLEPPCSVLVAAPVPLTIIQSILLLRGIKIPSEVELIAVFHSASSLFVYPAPIHYTFEHDSLAKNIFRVALHYFGTGEVPPSRLILPVEAVGRTAFRDEIVHHPSGR